MSKNTRVATWVTFALLETAALAQAEGAVLTIVECVTIFVSVRIAIEELEL